MQEGFYSTRGLRARSGLLDWHEGWVALTRGDIKGLNKIQPSKLESQGSWEKKSANSLIGLKNVVV
jgi:hypothetical protein